MTDQTSSATPMSAADIFAANFPESEIRELVENYWRAFLAGGNENLTLSAETTHHFENRIREIAAGLGGEHGEMFLAAIERHREALLREYQGDQAAFRRRLGIQPVPTAQRGDALTEIAVKTAVRATVWESIRALFGSFR